jgi:hypothetical protein
MSQISRAIISSALALLCGVVGCQTNSAAPQAARQKAFQQAADKQWQQIAALGQANTRPRAAGGAYLGIAISDEDSNGTQDRYPTVLVVVPNGPAARAGLRRGDLLIAVNGRQVRGSRDLGAALNSASPGAPTPVSIMRTGQAQALTVMPSLAPPKPQVLLLDTQHFQPAMAAPVSAPVQTTFHRVQAQDGTIAMDLPVDWQLMSATGQNFLAFSAAGESYRCGELDVFTDARSMQAVLQAYQARGDSRLQLAFAQRMVSPPLDAQGVVTRLIPQIAGGAMQSVRIVETRPLSGNGALVLYDYVLQPQRDALLSTILPPALRRYQQVPMRAAAFLFTTPASVMGVASIWSVFYQSVEAPQQVFARDGAMYERVFQSFSLNMQAVQANMAAAAAQGKSIGDSIKRQNEMVQAWSQRSMERQYKELEHNEEWNYRTGEKWVNIQGGQKLLDDPNTGFEMLTDAIHAPVNYAPYLCPNPGYPTIVTYHPINQPGPPQCTPLVEKQVQ